MGNKGILYFPKMNMIAIYVVFHSWNTSEGYSGVLMQIGLNNFFPVLFKTLNTTLKSISALSGAKESEIKASSHSTTFLMGKMKQNKPYQPSMYFFLLN